MARPHSWLFLLVILAACGDQESANPADESVPVSVLAEQANPSSSCTSLIVWQPHVLPGHLHEVDPAEYRDAVLDSLRRAVERDGKSLVVEEQAGFVFRVSHSPCNLHHRNTLFFPDGFPRPDSREDGEPFVYFEVPVTALEGRSLAEYSALFLAQDDKWLGMPPNGDEDSTIAGPNGYGRCTVYGVREASPDLTGVEPPLAVDQLYDDFNNAIRFEWNYGEHDYLPGFFHLDNLFGLIPYGDCEEASARATDFLDRAIAHMEGWGTDLPVIYHLFLPEQVEGLTENEILNRWQAGEIAPEGLTNAE